MINTFAAAVIEELRKDQQTLTTAIIGGRANSFEDYKHLTGQHRGIETAINTIEELRQAAEKE